MKKLMDWTKRWSFLIPLLADDAGGMEDSYTFDGVHLKAQYVSIWKDYLKTHVLEKLSLD